VDLGRTLVVHLLAISGTDIWAAALEGLLHFDGTAWSPRPAPTQVNLFEGFTPAAGTAASDVWALHWVGSILDTRTKDELYHYDGTNWTWPSLPAKFETNDKARWAASADELWLLGDGPRIWRRIGGQWSTLELPENALRCRGRSATDVFCTSY